MHFLCFVDKEEQRGYLGGSKLGEEEKDNKKKQTSDDLPIITEDDLDPEFKYEILKEPGGENFLRCMQCGTCTASCPVKAIDPDYNCRRIIRRALIGDKEKVLKSKFIWMCSTCYSCYEYCPQNVKVTDLMCAIQNIATRNGYTAPVLGDKIQLLKQHARTLPMDGFDNKKRSKFKLPPVDEKPEDIARIIEHTGIEKILEKSLKQVTNEITTVTQGSEI